MYYEGSGTVYITVGKLAVTISQKSKICLYIIDIPMIMVAGWVCVGKEPLRTGLTLLYLGNLYFLITLKNKPTFLLIDAKRVSLSKLGILLHLPLLKGPDYLYT